jgi:hypothetical protein
MPNVFTPRDPSAPPVRYRWLGFAIHGLLVVCVILIVCGLGVLAEFLRRSGLQLAYSSSGLEPKFPVELFHASLYCIGAGLAGLVLRDVFKALRDIALNSWAISERTEE